MAQRTFLIQPLNYTIKTSTITYEALSAEILGHNTAWYYLSNSPIGYPNHGKIGDSIHTLFLRQKCSLKSAIEEMVADDPLIIDINPEGKGKLTLYNSIPPGFKPVLQEIIFNHEPRGRTFCLNGSVPISFEYIQGKGLLHYELPIFDQQIKLRFTDISGIIQAKIYLVPINIGALAHTLLPNPQNSSNYLAYPREKVDCQIDRTTVQALVELPPGSKVKYVAVEGLNGNITNNWNGNWEISGNQRIFYPWTEVISKDKLRYMIETDTIQEKVVLSVFFKPGKEKKEEIIWKSVTLKHFRDDTYRGVFNEKDQLKAIRTTNKSYPNVYALYQKDGEPKLIQLKEKNGIYPIQHKSGCLVIIFSKHINPETYARLSSFKKCFNIDVCTSDYRNEFSSSQRSNQESYQQEKGSEGNMNELEDEISNLKIYLRKAEEEIVRLHNRK